jgi:hypothetical protein
VWFLESRGLVVLTAWLSYPPGRGEFPTQSLKEGVLREGPLGYPKGHLVGRLCRRPGSASCCLVGFLNIRLLLPFDISRASGCSRRGRPQEKAED